MRKNALKITVKCYAGHRGEETPRSIFFKNRKIRVEEVIDRWLAPDHRYFKFRGEDEATYLIRHDVEEDFWELVFYQAGRETNQRKPAEVEKRKRKSIRKIVFQKISFIIRAYLGVMLAAYALIFLWALFVRLFD